jgi:hypothetical protein
MGARACGVRGCYAVRRAVWAELAFVALEVGFGADLRGSQAGSTGG